MIIGIILFILLYLLLIAFSLGLLIGCSLLAVALVSFRASWITIVLALGLFALGVMFFFFTIKFIFGSASKGEPLEIEIDEKDHPVLFDFIRKLSKDVGTKFPGKIILTPEVNASVSYNSSFWSMFFPVRKNLRIGLGLVNTLNISEFKATIAHEFGHFSQRSMKTGSYVYTMNSVIYNLAYQRDDFDELLLDWARTGGTFSVFAVITSGFVERVRSILRASYNKLNITYRALSREMEYHADLVACSVAGNAAMVNTLRKLEIADAAYNHAIGVVNNMARQSRKRVADLYALHLKTMSIVAAGTSSDIYSGVRKSRLVLKDQWASHPSREDREASIARFTMQSPLMDQSAWILFTNPAATRTEMTQLLYQGNDIGKKLTEFSSEEVDEFIAKAIERAAISPTFHGIYDHRGISKFDPEKITKTSSQRFDELINTKVGEKIKMYDRDIADLQQVLNIAKKHVQIEFFEFDNVRYKAKEANNVVARLYEETDGVVKEIQALDEEIFVYYRQRAGERGQANQFIELYKKLLEKRTDHEIALSFGQRGQTMAYELATRTEWREDQVSNFCFRIQELEKQVKRFMRDFPEDKIRAHFQEPDSVFKYMEKERLWNESELQFNELGFRILQQYILASMNVANDAIWEVSKEIYKIQLELTPAEFVKAG
jgi:Zn-dependent protease with chaperone function